ncbi:sulfatase-like hydrolase/transferase [Niabella agricola]|uniref:sulfatase-like hydrolase/transferase n=1 Tax=Niabella agricola TaxID=2891571 RepID=UPI001F2D585A|nr:sulfatase-like hydrolase/transferase [Niabella agricola]
MILTLGDNLGYGDIGVYGQWRIKTSNIGQPVQEGTMFKSFYPGAAVCTPSRLPLMTAYPDIVLAKAAVMETGIFRNAGFPVEGRLEKANSTV